MAPVSTPTTICCSVSERERNYHCFCCFFLLSVFFFSGSPISWTLRKINLGFAENEIVATPLWNEIHESHPWQRGIYYTLCAAYACISLAAFAYTTAADSDESTRIWLDNTEGFPLHEFCGQWISVRAVLFGLHKSVFFIRPKARSTPAHKIRYAYYIINGIIYLTQACIWIYKRIGRTAAMPEVGMAFCAALGFLSYGGRLFILLRCFSIESRAHQKKLYEVGSVTCICCTYFIIRCITLAFSAFDKDENLDVLYHPILNLVYY